MRVTRSVRGTAALAVLLLLTGCVGTATPGDESTTPYVPWAEGPFGENCDWTGDLFTSPPTAVLPADAVLVSATRCLYDTEAVPGDGEWRVRTEQEATSGLDELADALRLSSQKPSRGNVACPAILYAPVIIHVTDTTGREMYPSVPTDACGGPLGFVTDTIAGLGWVDLDSTMVQQIRSELEVTSGCPAAWKPEIAMNGDARGTRSESVDTTERAFRVCDYDLDSDTHSSGTVDGTSYPDGRLVGASTLDAPSGGELLAAIASAPPAAACDQPEASFAVIHPLDGDGPYIHIERGGCHRALYNGENYLRQLDGTLVDRLIG